MADNEQSLRYTTTPPRTFDPADTSTYTVSSMIYPEDLLSDQAIYGGNYVIFYVNVHEDSKFVKDHDSSFLSDEQMKNVSRVRGDLRGQEVSKTKAVGVAAIQGGVTGTVVPVLGSATGLMGAGLAGGSQYLAGEILAKDSSSLTRKYKRMKEVIALHMPTDLSVKYGVQWSEEDTLTTAALHAGAEDIMKAVEAATKNVKNGIDEAASAAVKTLADGSVKNSLVSHILKAPGFGDYTSIATGVASNPKKEQMFRGVDYRTFTFTYRFYPRSWDEAEAVRNIIRAFKYHMHPEFKDDQNFLYIYPSEFDIVYYNNGQENMNLHRHTSCVLMDMNVTYGNQGNFVTFDDGMPVEVNMNLTFRELALLNKEHIEDNY